MRCHLALLLAILLALLPATAAAAQSPGAGPTSSTQVVASFDGTPITTTLFLPAGASAADPVPLVLRTHGWGGTGETEVGGTLQVLLDHGYAVLTWDQRGFGCSGGEVHIDRPDVEGRDASALIDWAVANAPIATDGDGDPLVGFTGASYAGGIQTATASIDPRVDAIAPEISWHDLRYSLYSGEVINQGWAALLYGLGLATATGSGLSPDCPGFAGHGPQAGSLHPRISRGFAEAAATGTVSDDVLDFFADSSLAHYGRDRPVAVPTLVLQGSVDTLFDLADGWRIVEHVRQQGAPARFVAYCGGHVACPPSYAEADDRAVLDAAILDWFDRYLRGDASVDTGAPVTYRTNEGRWRDAASFPPPNFGTLGASGSGQLASVPAVDSPDPDELQAHLEALQGGGVPGLPITTAQPANDVERGAGQAFTVPVATATDGPLELVGIPQVELAVDGVGTEVVVFARLVDREAGEVVNLQEGGVRVPLGGGAQDVEVPMPGVAYTLPEGHHLDLELATASLMHANARTPAQVDVEARVRVPADVPPGADRPPTEPARGRPGTSGDTPPTGDRVAAAAALPATGASLPLLLALLGLAVAAPRRRDG